jgi:hypothetical protein
VRTCATILTSRRSLAELDARLAAIGIGRSAKPGTRNSDYKSKIVVDYITNLWYKLRHPRSWRGVF